MRQFCAYRNCNADTRGIYPLLLNIQSDIIDETGTRVVVPLLPVGKGRQPAISALTPTLHIKGKPFLLVTPLLAGTQNDDLGALEADLASERASIMAALDFLVSGI